MGESSDGRQALPRIGPRGQAVIDQLLAAVAELEFCEHCRGDFAFWIAARPRHAAGHVGCSVAVAPGGALARFG
jgi:hypothetical protein